jgi:hypothetical protein
VVVGVPKAEGRDLLRKGISYLELKENARTFCSQGAKRVCLRWWHFDAGIKSNVPEVGQSACCSQNRKRVLMAGGGDRRMGKGRKAHSSISSHDTVQCGSDNNNNRQHLEAMSCVSGTYFASFTYVGLVNEETPLQGAGRQSVIWLALSSFLSLHITNHMVLGKVTICQLSPTPCG